MPVRSKTVSFKLTPREAGKFNAIARRNKISKSELIRSRVLNGEKAPN